MVSLRLLACSLAFACALAQGAGAGANWASGAGRGLGGERDVAMRLSATGTVTAVDMDSRLIAVSDRHREITFRLDPKVENAQGIQVGDRVHVDYVAGLVLARRNSEEARAQAARAASRRIPANMPLADAYDRPVVYVTQVVGIDRDELFVRLRGPDNEVRDYFVNDASDLAGMKTGDHIVVSMNQAVAVAVTPVTSPAPGRH
jgi:hypothetical protein